MKSDLPASISFRETVWLLLGAARKRSAGRRKRQQELLAQRTRKHAAMDWGWVGSLFSVLFMAGINVAAAFLITASVKTGQRVEAERQGTMVVSRHFLAAVKEAVE